MVLTIEGLYIVTTAKKGMDVLIAATFEVCADRVIICQQNTWSL